MVRWEVDLKLEYGIFEESWVKSSLTLTGSKCVDLIITDKCVFKVDKEIGLTLIELADGVTIKDLMSTTACSFKVKINYWNN